MAANLEFITMRVWLPDTLAGVHPPILTLENPNGLMFFLEALVHGNRVFPALKEFTIVAYQGTVQIGYGIYRIHFNDVGNRSLQNDPEPVRLEVVKEQGEIEGVVREAWGNMIKVVFAEEE